MLKSRLQKLDGLTHTELKENITKTIRNIPKDKQDTKNQEELFINYHIKWAF
jgi:hypothetical protein